MKNIHHKKRSIFSVYRGIKHWFRINIVKMEFTNFYIPLLKLNFKVPSNTIFGWHLSKYQIYEADSLRFLLGRFTQNQGGIFIDVGANFGWYSLIFSQFAGSEGRVLAFEPDPKNFDLLTYNKKQNSHNNIECFKYALGRQETELVLGKAPDSNPGMHSLVDLPHIDKSRSGETVQVRSLDDLLDNKFRVIELLKIDIEGYEVEAFKGALETIKRVKMILVEYSPAFIQASGSKKAEFFNILIESGFSFYAINKTGLTMLDENYINDLIKQENEPMYWQQDFICVNHQLLTEE